MHKYWEPLHVILFNKSLRAFYFVNMKNFESVLSTAGFKWYFGSLLTL